MEDKELNKNHQEIYEIFENFNKLIAKHDIDYYYTGGIVIYIEKNIPLKRYHSDLDILINEDSLEKLFKIIKNNSDFRIFNNLKTKRKGGHEFKILYKDYQVSIGLILFEKNKDNVVIKKEYYYDNNNTLKEINEIYSKEITALLFNNKTKTYHKTLYKTVTLESIYINKLENREKDIIDKNILERIIDKQLVEKLLKEEIKIIRKNSITNEKILNILEKN